MVRSDRVGHVLQQHGFAGARRRNNQSALAFAKWREQIHDSGADVFFHRIELYALLWIERRQVVEEDLVAGFVRRLKVDRFDLNQRKVLLAFMRRPYLAADGIAGFQVKFADLRRRNINVVGSGEVVVIGRTQKTITVRKDFEDTFGEDVALFLALRLEDLENQVLLAHAAGSGKIQRASDFSQLGYVLFFEFCNGHGFTCEGLE